MMATLRSKSDVFSYAFPFRGPCVSHVQHNIAMWVLAVEHSLPHEGEEARDYETAYSPSLFCS